MGCIKVAVLLAAYNGSEWIEDQLNSIVNQENVDVSIFISIDRSVDNTVALCESLSSKHGNIYIVSKFLAFGKASLNFFHLIETVPFEDFDYVALADQDDLWYSNKLFFGINRMRDGNYGGYSSNVLAFWPDGKQKLIRKSFPQRNLDFLFESPGPGCTFIMEAYHLSEFRLYMKQNAGLFKEIDLHDWALYAFFRSRGIEWLIDDAVHMLYRQHGNNVFGANASFDAFVKRFNLLNSGWYFNQVSLISIMSNFEEPTLGYVILNARGVRRRCIHRLVLVLSYVMFWRKTYNS